MKKQTKAGFTLIELLVVVLIIGILAAVAVPQYKKAVVKSHLAGIKPILAAIKSAEEAYYLANGSYTHNPKELDIAHSCKTMPNDSSLFVCDNYFVIDVMQQTTSSVKANYCPHNLNNWQNCKDNRDFTYTFHFHHDPTDPDKITCSGHTDLGKFICKAEGL